MKKLLSLALVLSLATTLNVAAFSSASSRTRQTQNQRGTQDFEVGTNAQGPVMSQIQADQLQRQIGSASSKATSSFGANLGFSMPGM